MTAKRVKEKDRKMQVIDMFSRVELDFINKKTKKGVKHLASRSAILRHLIKKAMENPDLLQE